MGWIASAALAVLVAAPAIQRLRADRRLGIPVNWPKTLVTLAGVVLTTLAAIGLMIGALSADRPGLAIALFVVAFGGGLAALVLAVNRRWPPEKT
jgi:hypothetical protein